MWILISIHKCGGDSFIFRRKRSKTSRAQLNPIKLILMAHLFLFMSNFLMAEKYILAAMNTTYLVVTPCSLRCLPTWRWTSAVFYLRTRRNIPECSITRTDHRESLRFCLVLFCGKVTLPKVDWSLIITAWMSWNYKKSWFFGCLP